MSSGGWRQVRRRQAGAKPAASRSCQRCGAPNSRVVGGDQYGRYIQCLTCSDSEYLPDERRPNLPFARSRIVHRSELDAEEDGRDRGNGGVD